MNRLDYAAALGMFVYASSVVATPIILLQIAAELEFGLAQGGGIEAVRAGFLLAILVASGFAAAKFGMVRSLGTGAVVLAAGLVAYAAAPSYTVVLGAIVLVGLGGGILEALLNPLVQDLHPQDSGRYLNILNAFFSFGVVAAVLVVGDLITRGVSWRVLMLGLAALAAVSGLLFFAFGRFAKRDTHVHAAPHTDRSPLQRLREIMRDRRLLPFAVAMFCGGGVEGGFLFWSASYIQLNFDTLARAGALGTAVFAGGMVVGRVASGHFVRQDRLIVLIVISACLGVAAGFGAWAVQTLEAFIAAMFCAGLATACFWPSIQSHAAAEMDVDSTMLFILLSCAGIPGFGLVSWLMGVIADVSNLRTSLLVLPVLLIVLVIAMLTSRSMGGPAVVGGYKKAPGQRR